MNETSLYERNNFRLSILKEIVNKLGLKGRSRVFSVCLILFSYSVDRGVLCLEIKRPEHEADHSPPYDTKVKNEYIDQLTPSYSFIGCVWTTLPLCLPSNIILPSASSCINFVSLPCMSRSSHNCLIICPK